MPQKPQTQKILSWLKQGRKITAIQALNMFGCFRLSARINDLRESGHIIESKMVMTDTGKHISQYKLIK